MKLARHAAWLIPFLVSLAAFYPGLECWFQMDDFAWLKLVNEVHDWPTFIETMFVPKAQGTIRPISERAFFLGFSYLFGLNAFPYRVWAVLTQMAALILVSGVTWRLTGSGLAAACAALFWGVNAALAAPMSWTSAYNQILCAVALTGALYSFIRYAETSRRRYLLFTWLVFLSGFGVLEINVVFPALAAAYALLYARKLVWKVAPMAAVSILFVLVHNRFAPKTRTGLYALYFDSSMGSTLAYYLRELFDLPQLKALEMQDWFVAMGDPLEWVLWTALAAFLILQAWSGNYKPLFGVVFFLAAIAPVLPLRDHLTEYYLTVPAIGIAITGGWAFASAWGRGWPGRILAVTLASYYLVTAIPVDRRIAAYNRERSQGAQSLVEGIQIIARRHPGKIVLLKDVGPDLFFSAVNDDAFSLLGAQVFLAPGAEETIKAEAEYGDVLRHVLPPRTVLRHLNRKEMVVYAVAGHTLRNITEPFHWLAATQWKPDIPRHVDAGQASYAEQLGEGWHKIEQHYRWMSRRAVVILGGPERKGQRLQVSGFLPAAVIQDGPARLTVTINGRNYPPVELTRANQPFEFTLPLETIWVGREKLEVVLESDKTITDTDVTGQKRELALTFGTFYIR